ncbi:kelch-like protein 24 [Saccostrea echinata]|uniref:kelch-like protein 24 n=1 Tax=Saccostrea echinata TaxID=191078 RepID=UPI002A7F699D|nr:kelch-like protein 24 [Saccostrea echinata]
MSYCMEKDIMGKTESDRLQSDYITAMVSGLQQLYESSQYTDVEIVVESRTFHCHRLILAAMSPYFDAMFSSGMIESQNHKVNIQNVPSSTFNLILQFIYSGTLALDEENVGDVLQTSVMMQIKCLKERCEEFMISKVDIENCIGTWKLAQGHGCHYLTQKSFRFILHYFAEVCQTEDFRTLDVFEVISIISDNDLNVKNEEIVIETVFDWLHADICNRKQHIKTLFEHLRLPLLQPEYLLEVVEQNPLIQNETECKEILDEAKRYHLLPARRQEFISPRLVYRNLGDFEEVVVCIGGSNEREQTTRTVVCCRKNKNWNYLESLPYDPGVEFATCSYGNAIFVSGGSSKLKGMLCFHSNQNIWTRCQSMLLGRRRHSMEAVGDSVYVLGGFDDANEEEFQTILAIEKFKLSTGEWEDCGYLSTPVRSASSAVDREKIFLFGGVTGENFDTKIVQCFDTRRNTCSVISQLPVFCRLSSAIGYQRKVIIVCPDGKILSFEDGTVEDIGCIPGFERYSFGSVLQGDSINIYGGIKSSEVFNDVISFNLSSKTASLTGTYMPESVFGFGCAKCVIHKKYLNKPV